MKDYSVPLKIIRVLSDGEFHSGEQLGEKLGMSRAAINQHIHTLKNWVSISIPLPARVTASPPHYSY
ncbi:HTH domain-containing protein [Tatumella ptyseos]|uniref:Bifunctional protein BirA n=1 Tax=Tatumella ptyseos TaxID=82987 RepID=A0A2X5NF98_9GAMM|nr:HTH domain-containing protein [Tatumella ptyseos]SQK71786.1 Bifunctional protein BirA [Tatumella ptyseos]